MYLLSPLNGSAQHGQVHSRQEIFPVLLDEIAVLLDHVLSDVGSPIRRSGTPSRLPSDRSMQHVGRRPTGGAALPFFPTSPPWNTAEEPQNS